MTEHVMRCSKCGSLMHLQENAPHCHCQESRNGRSASQKDRDTLRALFRTLRQAEVRNGA